MKANVVIADPAWSFSDALTMSDIKRGASSNYPVLSNKAIKELDVESIVADDAVLALWVPSSLLQDGLVKLYTQRDSRTESWCRRLCSRHASGASLPSPDS